MKSKNVEEQEKAKADKEEQSREDQEKRNQKGAGRRERRGKSEIKNIAKKIARYLELVSFGEKNKRNSRLFNFFLYRNFDLF